MGFQLPTSTGGVCRISGCHQQTPQYHQVLIFQSRLPSSTPTVHSARNTNLDHTAWWQASTQALSYYEDGAISVEIDRSCFGSFLKAYVGFGTKMVKNDKCHLSSSFSAFWGLHISEKQSISFMAGQKWQKVRLKIIRPKVQWRCAYYLGGGFKYFLCSPLPWEMIQFDEHIFQLGRFNHQLDNTFMWSVVFVRGGSMGRHDVDLIPGPVDGSEILRSPVDMETLPFIIYIEAFHDSRDIFHWHRLHTVGGCIHHNVSILLCYHSFRALLEGSVW